MKKEIYSKPNSRFDENHPEGKPTQSRREGSKMRQICMGLMRGAALTQNMCRTIFTQFILPRAVTTFTLFEENWGPRKNLEKNRKQKLEKKFRKNQEKFRKNVEKKSETFWKNFGEHFGKVRNISNKIKKKIGKKSGKISGKNRKNFGNKSEKFRGSRFIPHSFIVHCPHEEKRENESGQIINRRAKPPKDDDTASDSDDALSEPGMYRPIFKQ